MITSRMRFMSSQLETPLRIVGLSTSLANARDVGEWIGASSHGLFNFPPGDHTLPQLCDVASADSCGSSFTGMLTMDAEAHRLPLTQSVADPTRQRLMRLPYSAPP